MEPFSKFQRILIGLAAGALFWTAAYIAMRSLGTGTQAFAAYAAVIVGVGTVILIN